MSFPAAARRTLADSQQRRNIGKATSTIRAKREVARECCGFGGVFAVKNADTSMAMLSDKLRHVLDTGAEVCTSADNSCLMSIGGALRRQRAGVRTVHIAEILAAQE
jgi:L-lactate dehydrogenase complex protein LldE